MNFAAKVLYSQWCSMNYVEIISFQKKIMSVADQKALVSALALCFAITIVRPKRQSAEIAALRQERTCPFEYNL
jgi:hypothetical protein